MNNIIFFSRDDVISLEDNAIICSIDKNIRNKESLLNILAGDLFFPGTFGYNWDALYDCLCDLSWLKEGTIIIFHKELPEIKERLYYLEVLIDAIYSWRNRDKHMFLYFPEEDMKVINNLLKST